MHGRHMIAAMLTLGMMATPVFAHPHVGLGVGSTFAGGVGHAWLGFDHLFAAIAVGVLAGQSVTGGSWRFPAYFLLLMLLGFVCGQFIPAIDSTTGLAMIATIVLAVWLMLPTTTPNIMLPLTVGLAGLIHGHSHGSEVLAGVASPVTYLAGLAIATLMLHVLGVACGRIAVRLPAGKPIVRLAAGSVASVGMFFLFVSL